MISLSTDPLYLTFAIADIGLREIPGAADQPRILAMLKATAAWLTSEADAWCGAAMAQWMRQAGIDPPPKSYRAMSWTNWGNAISVPKRGCVVVLPREGGGHVALAVGWGKNRTIVCLGGNQGDSVGLASFPVDRIVAFRLPPGIREYADLAPMDADASRGEA